jgi:RNA polymerase sigma-70 factor, ECF subfamily
MSTTPYNPEEANVPPARVLRNQGLTNAASEAVNSLGSQLLPRSSFHDGNYACGHAEASDDDLVTAAQHGDQKAFAELCGRYSALTKQKIFMIVRNHEDAEDALQDTLLRAYTHLTTFRGSCKFSTWLTAIGVNSALMLIRKQKLRRETAELREPLDRSPGPEGIYLKQQAILHLRREVEKLRPSLRSVVNHYYGCECSLKETAKAQEISLRAAKSRLLRGRAKLRSSLAGYGISKPCN